MCRGPKKCPLNAILLMLDFCSRPVYHKTSLTSNSFTQITGTPSKPELKARGAVTNFWATKVQNFPVLKRKRSAKILSQTWQNMALHLPRRHPEWESKYLWFSGAWVPIGWHKRCGLKCGLKFINQQQRETFRKASPCSTMHDLKVKWSIQ